MTAAQDAQQIKLVPITLAEAKRFCGTHHRHNSKASPPTWKFGVGLAVGEQLVGIAMAGLPKSRHMMDGVTLEVNRVCTLGHRNANSMLYGAIARAAQSLGYSRLITYTLETESGSSLRACGWTHDGTRDSNAAGWESAGGSRAMDLFGDRLPDGPKQRWVKHL